MFSKVWHLSKRRKEETAEEAREITYKSEKNRQETQIYKINYV